MTTKTIGNRFKTLREKQGLTVAEVARKLDLSPSTYREWEYGRAITGEPYLELAELFKVNLEYLLTGKKESLQEKNQLLDDLQTLKKLLEKIELSVIRF